MASARVVAGRVDGSEVDSTLGANIVTAGESGGIVEWEDVSCPASPAESSPLLRYGARLSTVAQNFFFWTAVERLLEYDETKGREAERSQDAEVRRGNFR